MAKIQILGQFECVTSEGILAVAEQIKYSDTTVAAAIAAKQNALTFDSAPTENSTNPVTSGGLYTTLSDLDTSLKAYADTAASAATVTLDTVTVAQSGWSLHNGYPRYNTNILPAAIQTKKYYDIHLANSNSFEVSIACAKSDIRVVAESNGLYLYAYNATAANGWTSNKPNFDFVLEIVTTSITTNVTGLSYDIGDDFVINVTEGLDTRLTAAENGLGASTDAASASGTTAWSRIKQNTSDISSVDAKLGASTDTASASGTVAWPRIKNAESNITSLQNGLGTSSDAASASGTTAWSRIKQNTADITSTNTKIGSSTDTASSSSTVVWPRLKNAEANISAATSSISTATSNITALQNGLGTSADTASATGTTAWSRIKQSQTDITALQGGLGTSADAASASGTTAWSRIKQNAADIATLQTNLSALETNKVDKMILCAINKSVVSSAWSASGDATYAYKADITMTGLDASYFPIVQFEDADVADYYFSPNAVPKTNAITIYCKTKPARTITLPNIICFKATAV